MHSDKGLLLEKSALESLYGGQFTLSTQLIEPNYVVQYHSPSQHHCSFSYEKLTQVIHKKKRVE